ncbi:hypothetical protein Tco_1127602 [Tanacetum coccineum]
MSNTSDKCTTFGDGAARVVLLLDVPLSTVDDFAKKLINDIEAGTTGHNHGEKIMMTSKASFSLNLIPVLDDFTKSKSSGGYKWRPPRCDTCKIFGHVHNYCPKKVVSPPIVATSNVVTPNAEKTNDGFQTVGKKKKRKGKSKSTNGGQVTGHSVKLNVRYEPKATTSAPKKGTTYVGYTSQSTPMLKTTDNSSKKDNLSMSSSFSDLNEEEEEDVENVYDESANLILNTKAGGSSSFTPAAG